MNKHDENQIILEHKILALYQKVSEISAMLASMRTDNYEDTINAALKLLGDFVGVDRIYTFKYDFQNYTCSNTFEYCKKGISPEIDNLQDVPLDNLEAFLDLQYKKETAYIYDVPGLEPNHPIKLILEPQGIKSWITIPLFHGEHLYGFLGFDSVLDYHEYSDFEQKVLKEFANLLINGMVRIESEIALEKEALKVQHFIDATNSGVWEWDLETNIIKINQNWAKIIGYNLSELHQPFTIDTWKQFTHPEDLKEALIEIDKTLKGENSIYQTEIRMMHKNGHYVWVRDTGKVIEWYKGKPKVMLGAHFDITNIKNSEQTNKAIKVAIDSSSTAVVITDKDNKIVYTNPMFEQNTGYTFSEVKGLDPKFLKSNYHNTQYYAKMWKTLLEGKSWVGEFYNKKKDGTYYWEHASIAPVMNDKNEITFFVATKEDITEKKNLDIFLKLRKNELEREVKERVQEIYDAQRSAILAFAKLTESRDETTGLHIDRVQYLSQALAKSMQQMEVFKHVIDNDFVKTIHYASALHDLGKIKTPDAILLKPGKLTPEEYDIMKQHVSHGSWILNEMKLYYANNQIVNMGEVIAKYHHEKWDGTGYLEGLKGEEIPIEARIMALVDVYDALRSERPYKKAMSHEEAMKIIISEKGKHFDPNVVEAFLMTQDYFASIYETIT